ncbi:MAG: hypothetical protein M3R17_04490 [Bacteroidota bacterium]|nr:hypothetical protein [Bacteroidota bacterium]
MRRTFASVTNLGAKINLDALESGIYFISVKTATENKGSEVCERVKAKTINNTVQPFPAAIFYFHNNLLRKAMQHHK